MVVDRFLQQPCSDVQYELLFHAFSQEDGCHYNSYLISGVAIGLFWILKLFIIGPHARTPFLSHFRIFYILYYAGV